MDDFDDFARAHGPALSRLAFLLCGDRGYSEDLVQSTLWKAHKSWSRVEQVEFPAAYVRKILVREYLSWRRRRWMAEIPLAAADLDVDLTPARPDPAERVAETDAVRRLLHSLPRKQRAVLVMRYYLDLPDDVIAESMGCSQSTVRSNVMRGLQTLRTSLPIHWEEAVHDAD